MGRRTDELLYDSQAALRLVDRELRALCDPLASERLHADPDAATSSAGQPAAAERAAVEITRLLASLRASRATLARAGAARLQRTEATLREVSSATQVAATDILDALDRVGRTIDELDAADGAGPAAGGGEARGPALRARLREELFAIVGALQFQDIAAQQLAYASGALVEVETRLGEIARLFDPAAGDPDLASPSAPDATTQSAAARQALVDRIVAGRG